MRYRTWQFRGRACTLLVGVVIAFQLGPPPALAGGSWLSKARIVAPDEYTPLHPADDMSPAIYGQYAHAPMPRSFPTAPGDIGTTVFDIVISLYNDPSGDDDPNNDTGAEDQTNYEEIIRFWADAICEESNAAFKLGKVRIFRNGIHGSLADVVWNANEWPRAAPSGFGVSGEHITFGDVFPDGCGTGCDINFLNAARHEDAGYTLGHEFGHYVLGLYDEYEGSTSGAGKPIYWPRIGDIEPDSIMNDQWNAVGGNFEWLNHSTEDNYEAKTGQGRAYGASCWEVMIREVSDDPKDGTRSTLAQRVRYTTLVGEEPTAADGWVIENLPGAQTDCRSELEIIWMQDDIELQIVVDRSGSMDGDPLANAKQAAKTLVDEVEDGKTALGVVSFNHDVEQSSAILDVPADISKADIKNVIDGFTAGGTTAMFDAADLALDNLMSYATTEGTNAAQLVFLLSDGLDNSSTETQATVTAAYQAADVPLSTFAYGGFAPEGVLRQMAEDTGGLFRTSPTDLAEVQSAFLSVKAALTSSAAVLQESSPVPASGSTNFSFAVDSTLRELSIFANYVGALSEVTFSLSGPGGPVGGASFACTDVAGSTSCSAAVDEANVTAQGTGTWSLNATNNTGSAIDVNADILATPLPTRTYDLVLASLDGTEVSYPDPILLTATVSRDWPITGVNVLSATITDPSGATIPINLVDTGQDGDGLAGDGTYSAIVDYTMSGIHSIAVTVDNVGLTAQFTTEAFLPAHVRAPIQGGGDPVPPPLPSIDESFMRSANLQVLVSGVVGDDHPDAAPGTIVLPDNGDVAGRVDFSGDPDVFTVPTAGFGFNFMTFRVTGLGLGMKPHLRILEENGTTEIISATIDDLPDGAAYLALTVPVSGNAQLHAVVTHADGGTGTYQFSAGERIFSDPPLFGSDIKVGSCPNPLNRESHGMLPIAILGMSTFDYAMMIDLPTVRLSRADGAGDMVAPNEGPPGPHSVFADVGTPFMGQPCGCHTSAGDGITDLSMHFSTDAAVAALQLNDLTAGALVPLQLSGSLADGTPFTTTIDCIRLVPKGMPPGLLSVRSTANEGWFDIDVLDEQLDGGGFGQFERTYPVGAVVTLTAPAYSGDRRFSHWIVDGVEQPIGRRTVEVAIYGDTTTADAVYGTPNHQPQLIQHDGVVQVPPK